MSDALPHCVVVGAGHAAAQLCASLVQAKSQSKWPGRLTVIGDDPLAPYHRPPLSKTQLSPVDPPPVQMIRAEAFYADHGIALRTGERVQRIDRDAKRVELAGDDGGAAETLDYDKLVLATGSTHRRPPVKGIDLPGVYTLQTAAHAEAVRGRLAGAKQVVVIGAGFIGLEVAASLRKLGVGVTVLEFADRPLARVTSGPVSDFFAALHRGHGVDLRTSTAAASIEADGDGLSVTTSAGDVLPADFVVVGAGAAANDQLAADAGLETGNGVHVDENNRTTDPSIYAIGDCCSQHSALYGTRMRLESVQNATDQAKTAAAAILGAPRPHVALPWFWSDQYDVKLQIAGVSTGYDNCVIRGTPEPGHAFSAWYLKDGRLLAVDAVNDARAYAVGSKIIPTRGCPDAKLIADPATAPKDLIASARASA